MSELFADSPHQFWLLAAGYDTYVRSASHARLDTPWNAFTEDGRTLVCALWRDLIVEARERESGAVRRFARVGGRMSSWQGMSVKNGRVAQSNIEQARRDRLPVVGYEVEAKSAALAKGVRTARRFFMERSYSMKAVFELSAGDALAQLEPSPELARLRADADGRVDPGYLFELIPARGIVDNVALSEDDLLDARLSEEDLANLVASQMRRRADTSHGQDHRQVRLASVAAYTRKRANGNCEACGDRGFPTERDEPYLESHHIQWLANRGEDHPGNTAALCPQCHREAHSGVHARRLELARKLATLRFADGRWRAP